MVNTIFVCSKCDAQFPKWAGRCLGCGAWGTIAESRAMIKKKPAAKLAGHIGAEVVNLHELNSFSNPAVKQATNLNYLDAVLGGGVVAGAVLLLGGDPGVGKSTLALQLAAAASFKVLYISAEESASQVAERLSRLNVANKNNQISFANESNVEAIIASIIKNRPDLVIIDSVQTIFSEELNSQTGSINQVKASASKLIEIAKSENISLLLIGHVTKEGDLAGPKTLEHLVDVVMYLEGDKYKQYRLLRASKNRFGPIDEVAILEMVKTGLQTVANPSQIFLAKKNSRAPGSVICAVAEGSQVFLVEVQALVAKTAFNYPKRSASGFDQKRLELLTTIITKKTGLNLVNFDVYVNIAGGLTLKEPALDLAVAASIMSAFMDKVLPEETVVFGEIGLGGEIRTVVKTKERVKEALKLGFKKIILPEFEGAINQNLVKAGELKEIIKVLQ